LDLPLLEPDLIGTDSPSSVAVDSVLFIKQALPSRSGDLYGTHSGLTIFGNLLAQQGQQASRGPHGVSRLRVRTHETAPQIRVRPNDSPRFLTHHPSGANMMHVDFRHITPTPGMGGVSEIDLHHIRPGWVVCQKPGWSILSDTDLGSQFMR
jgi:hypothetical protein